MEPEELMDKGKVLLKSKADDYTSGRTDRYENFTRQAKLISWFEDNNDRAFVALIAVKLARLGSLLKDNKKPNHESIEDTFIDLINYCALWGGFRLSNKTKQVCDHHFGVITSDMGEFKLCLKCMLLEINETHNSESQPQRTKE